LVQLPSGQTVHVQGMIQAAQPSVIQSPQMQAAQVASVANAEDSTDSEGVIESQKRREILSRRPSYRKILNELSSDATSIPKIEEEKSEEEGTPSCIPAMAVPTSLYQTSTGQYIAIAQGGAIQISNPASDGVQGLQTLTMTNSGAPQPGATIVQYAAQTPDGTQQFFVPGSQVVVQGIFCDLLNSEFIQMIFSQWACCWCAHNDDVKSVGELVIKGCEKISVRRRMGWFAH
uniref:cAMP-responsive element modulator n=1 Tax=Pelusios castaneus TaxID=367368 RepID=A0A8C8S940_9SAUR